MSPNEPTKNKKPYDVVIVGAGPAGLAALSALKEPYTLDALNSFQLEHAQRVVGSKKDLRVCVVDPNPEWLTNWNDKLNLLEIDFLRSPAMAHPDHFDQNALLAYAVANQRDTDDLVESGCGDLISLLPLGQSQVGLWKLPSTRLFQHFCDALVQRLPHDFVQGSVVAVDKNDTDDGRFDVQLSDGSMIASKSVVLAMGMVGNPVVPRRLANVPINRMLQWTELEKRPLPETYKRVLVVGGGLTAVQVAQQQLRQRKQVVLCSRRPLVERHFDLGMDWFDRRTANKCMADFYHISVEQRLQLLKESRGGGSVPPIYMRDLERWERKGQLVRVTGDASYACTEKDGTVGIDVHDKTYLVDAVVLACGVQPDCLSNQLVEQTMDKWSTPVVGGFPVVSEDLELAPGLFCLGSMASLNLGPDAGNLMGIKRGATIIANRLGCRNWLREKRVLSSRFEALWESDTEDESSDTDDDDE